MALAELAPFPFPFQVALKTNPKLIIVSTTWLAACHTEQRQVRQDSARSSAPGTERLTHELSW